LSDISRGEIFMLSILALVYEDFRTIGRASIAETVSR
jgi:hypothetical protein